jgi:hypothetical protein
MAWESAYGAIALFLMAVLPLPQKYAACVPA